MAESATWRSINDVRKTYASADSVGKFTVFNIKGNKYRLIVKIEYTYQKIFSSMSSRMPSTTRRNGSNERARND